MIEPVLIPKSELDARQQVTYAEGGAVFHLFECRARQRILHPKETFRRDALSMKLEPCRNCERRK